MSGYWRSTGPFVPLAGSGGRPAARRTKRMRRVAGGAFALAGAVGLVAYPVTAASPSVADLATRAGLLRLTITADRRGGTIDSQGVADSRTAKHAASTATPTTTAKAAANGSA